MANKEKPVRSFFKNNPFFSVKEEEAQTQPATAPATGTYANPVFNPSVVPQSNFPMPPPIQTPDGVGDVEQQYLDHFMQFLESKNFAGLDYLEFANVLHKMYEKTGSTLPESGLYELAYASFEAQGITKEKLIETAQAYIKLTNDHKAEFDKFLESDGSKTLQDKTTENARLEKANGEASLQIAQLEQQVENIKRGIATNIATIQTNTALIQSETQKNQAKKQKFESAYRTVISKISGDIDKIKNFLK